MEHAVSGRLARTRGLSLGGEAPSTSVLNSVHDRSFPDPVWGLKISANYEELRQHCLSFIDKYSATPTITPGSVVSSLEPYVSSLPEITPAYVAEFRGRFVT